MSNLPDPIRVGIAGLGRSGWDIHARAFKAMPERYRVVALADQLPDRVAACAAKLGVTAHASVEALAADPNVELVVVATYNIDHARHVELALRSEKHVVCEKPFGLTTLEVDQMIAAAAVARKVLQPFQQRRYEADFLKIREVIASGILGEVQFIRTCWHGFKRRWDWQTDRSFAGGTMNNNGPHPIDHALELLGSEDPSVWAETRRCLCSGDAEDHLKIVLSARGRPTIDIELSDIFAYGQDRWLVCGTAGGLRGNADALEWKWVDWTTMPDRPLEPHSAPDRSYNKEALPWQLGAWNADAAPDTGGGATPSPKPVLELYADLYATIRHGAPQRISPQSVRRRVEIMETVRRLTGIAAGGKAPTY